MRRKSPPRVVGPYEERGKWRVVVVENGERKSFFFPSKEEALKLREQFTKEVSQPPSRKLADVVVQWENDRACNGTCKPETAVQQAARMRLFLESFLAQDLAALTPRGAAMLYLNHTQRPSARTGLPLSAASHQLDLVIAKHLFEWTVKRGYIGLSPFKGVKAVGKLKAGKPQLRIEEARRFAEAALRCFEQKNKPLAIGVLLALTMGLRTGEVLNRVVRDLDDGARYLWIDQGKTVNARRHLEVPAMLQSYLLRLAAGKGSDELLFGLSAVTGRPYRRQSMNQMVRMLCKMAGVPRVCTHSLRGLWATLAVRSGMASHAIAESLGHHSFATTQRHYAQPAASVNVGTERVVEVLDGSRFTAKVCAEDLLQQLDEDTLVKLTELLAARKAKGDPAN